MPSVDDVVVKKPSEQEAAKCKQWPTWSCEASEFDWDYSEQETCLLLEGKVTVSDPGSSVSFGAGDMVVFPVDLKCSWKIHEAVVKHYNFG